MIDAALTFLKDRLNQHLRLLANGVGGDGEEDKVVFLDGEKMDPVFFKLGAVTVLLINIDEERILRPADPYVRMTAAGTKLQVQPDLRLELSILFVARFKQYEDALRYLSHIIQFFQVHRHFDPSSDADLAPSIHRLGMELMPLPFSQQNDLWNALRTTYHPSILYKTKLILFEDGMGRAAAPVGEPRVDLRHARSTAV